MAVYVNNLSVNKEVDFNQVFTLASANNSNLNLTGYKFKSEIRKHSSSVGVTTFTVTNLGSSQIQVGLTSTQTSNMKEGRYIYDIVMTDNDGVTSRVIEGMVLVRPSATRL